MIEVAKIKSLAKRINALMDERDGILADIRDIYAEAKSHDIVPKVLRKVIARQRAKDPAALILEDDLLDTYLAALDGPTRRAVEMAASGATAREIEAETGIDHVTVSRSVSLKKDRETNSQTADLDTLPGDGEASADERDASASSPPTRAEIAPVEIFAESANNRAAEISLYQRITGAFHDIPREPPKATEAKANHPPQGAASVAAGPQDDLTLPRFLDRWVTA